MGWSEFDAPEEFKAPIRTAQRNLLVEILTTEGLPDALKAEALDDLYHSGYLYDFDNPPPVSPLQPAPRLFPDWHESIDRWNRFEEKWLNESLRLADERGKSGDPLFFLNNEELKSNVLDFLRLQQSRMGRLYTDAEAGIQARNELENQRWLKNQREAHGRNRFLSQQSTLYSLRDNPLSSGQSIPRDEFLRFLDELSERLQSQLARVQFELVVEGLDLYKGDVSVGYAQGDGRDWSLPYSEDESTVPERWSHDVKALLSTLGPIAEHRPSKFSTGYWLFRPETKKGDYRLIIGRSSFWTEARVYSLTESVELSKIFSRLYDGNPKLLNVLALYKQFVSLQLLSSRFATFQKAVRARPKLGLKELRGLLSMLDFQKEIEIRIIKKDIGFILGSHGFGKLGRDQRYILGRYLGQRGAWQSYLKLRRTRAIYNFFKEFHVRESARLTWRDFKAMPIDIPAGPNSRARWNEDAQINFVPSFSDEADVVRPQVPNSSANFWTGFPSPRSSLVENVADPLKSGAVLYRVRFLNGAEAYAPRYFNLRSLEDFSVSELWAEPRGSEKVDLIVSETVQPGVLGERNIPTPDGYALVAFNVISEGKELHLGQDYTVRSLVDGRSGYYVHFNEIEMDSSTRIECSFQKLKAKSKFLEAELQWLSPRRLLQIIGHLREAGFQLQADSLLESLERRREGAQSYGIERVIAALDGTSLYSDRRARVSVALHPPNYAALKAFLDYEGIFHAQCLPANVLFAMMGSEYFADHSRIRVRLKTVVELVDNSYIDLPLHVQTEFHDESLREDYVVDATPTRLSPSLERQKIQNTKVENVKPASTGVPRPVKAREDYEQTLRESWNRLLRSYMAYQKANENELRSLGDNRRLPWSQLRNFFLLVDGALKAGGAASLRRDLEAKGYRGGNLAALVRQRTRDLRKSFESYRNRLRRKGQLTVAELRYLDQNFGEALQGHFYLLDDSADKIFLPVRSGCEALALTALTFSAF